MGQVYEATDESGRRRVAVKLLASDLATDPAFVKRFHREARVLGSLAHPHIVDIFDRGEHDGRLWFAMEIIRGENLRHRIHRGPLPPKEAVRIAHEIASALEYAHQRGVVHRDLKPENVLLDADGRVHLVDFGLSRLPSDGGPDASTLLTRTDVILGTYEYMAPEQRRGTKDLDGRADLYALGVILYEMLTGALPLGHFDTPSRLRPDVPEILDRILGFVMLLSFVGMIGASTLERMFWLRPFGILLLIGGIFLLRQGGRLSRMATGSREGQVTASVILLFLPPVGTLVGLYALKVFTGDDARQAFRVGRRALEGPRPVVAQRMVKIQRQHHRKPAPPWLHVLVLVSMLWAVYSAVLLVTTDVQGTTAAEIFVSMSNVRSHAIVLGLGGALLSLVAGLTAFPQRRARHGLGMAVTAFTIFLGTTWFLSGMTQVFRGGPTDAPRPRSGSALSRPVAPSPSLSRLEYRR